MREVPLREVAVGLEAVSTVLAWSKSREHFCQKQHWVNCGQQSSPDYYSCR